MALQAQTLVKQDCLSECGWRTGVRGGPVTQSTTNLITVSLLPVAILMIGYALTTFILRSIYLQRKQVWALFCIFHEALPIRDGWFFYNPSGMGMQTLGVRISSGTP